MKSNKISNLYFNSSKPYTLLTNLSSLNKNNKLGGIGLTNIAQAFTLCLEWEIKTIYYNDLFYPFI